MKYSIAEAFQDLEMIKTESPIYEESETKDITFNITAKLGTLYIDNVSGKSVKEKLQKYINENFKKFFNGDISLHIDPKYSIKVVVTGKVDTLETSTGQGIAVIFAFLAAVIRIAKENDENADTYPIVMDAPLSTLDKERIKSVCVTLPSIADQVIVFIKDTDGEVAEQNLDNRIGKKLYFNKIDQYTTEIR